MEWLGTVVKDLQARVVIVSLCYESDSFRTPSVNNFSAIWWWDEHLCHIDGSFSVAIYILIPQVLVSKWMGFPCCSRAISHFVFHPFSPEAAELYNNICKIAFKKLRSILKKLSSASFFFSFLFFSSLFIIFFRNTFQGFRNAGLSEIFRLCSSQISRITWNLKVRLSKIYLGKKIINIGISLKPRMLKSSFSHLSLLSQ